MTASPTYIARAAAANRELAAELAAALAGEMIQRWRQGERVLAEDFLARHPLLWEQPEAAADLIFEELCLRQEYGAEITVDELLARFPQWRPQLEVLFDCQRVLGPRTDTVRFPQVGDSIGDFQLLSELGRGAQGRVFLASQQSLGLRRVVLKLTSLEAGEHLSLARLQHTHIVPLYSSEDLPARGLRALCMPYFGGATLADLLRERRAGESLLAVIDRFGSKDGCMPGPKRERASLQTSYSDSICWIGVCLANALQYAHERDLLHLDLKPSNVLLSADGQPMLLDFHLARPPISPDGARPQGIGGTPGYMAPEHELALRSVQEGRPIRVAVDRRADVFSLGVVLVEALGGKLAAAHNGKPNLELDRAQASTGLCDILSRSVASDPESRYPTMAAFADDLRRHLSQRPLAGVRNRSLAERWRKWRRRRPQGLALVGTVVTVSLALAAVTFGLVGHLANQVRQARTALDEGHMQVARAEWQGAIHSLQRGQSLLANVPFQSDLRQELDRLHERAQEGKVSAEKTAALRALSQLAERVRFLYGARRLSSRDQARLEPACRELWDKRGEIVERLRGPQGLDRAVRDDLLDVAIFWASLQQAPGGSADSPPGEHKALAVLDDARALLGDSPVLEEERKIHGGTPNKTLPPTTTWDHYALGRALLRENEPARAAGEMAEALRLEPRGLWPNYYLGQCAFRQGRYEIAATAFSVCIGATADAAGCFYDRALAFEALGRADDALRDYDQALAMDPTLAPALLHRGLLHLRMHRSDAACSDLLRARELGADPWTTSLALGLMRLERREWRACLDHLRHALQPR